MRYFNVIDPVVPEEHYCIPALERWDLDQILALIRDKCYFELHAPRHTGKTSVLLALRDLLNSGSSGDYRCVYMNVEGGRFMGEDREGAMRVILGELANHARITLGDEFLSEEKTRSDILERAGPDRALSTALSQWAKSDPKPAVLLIDNIDSLVGDTLLSVLRQIRASFDRRPRHFPQSIVLCGVGEVRDYRIHSGNANEVITGGSPFNIKAESFRLEDFSREEVVALLGQHTEETGQAFSPEALEAVWTRTQGQPGLVNALASWTCFPDDRFRDFGRAVEAEDIREAEEVLIANREVQLYRLADKLREDRVRRVVGPLLSGGKERSFTAHDLEYVRDLGLIARDSPLRIANPIYAEMVPHELTRATRAGRTERAAEYVDDDGTLNLSKLLTAFQEFFQEISEHWLERFEYKESGPQLLLQAFLQHVVDDGGGRIEREYGLGRRRVDLLVVWPKRETRRKYVVECKLLHKGLDSTIRSGLEQTAGYMDQCGAESGHLVIFDRDEKKQWEEKIFRRRESFEGTEVEIWGM